MSFIWRCIYIIAILNTELPSHSPSFIHKIINDTFNYNKDSLLDFRFSIKVNKLEGVILYGFDSKRNQFGIDVVQDGSEAKYIRKTFNKKCEISTLKRVCGCDPCDDREIEFYVIFFRSIYNVRCKSRYMTSRFFTMDDGDYQECDIIEYPIPMLIINKTDIIYLMMGNIGPYVGEGYVNVAPLQEQMVGCIHNFRYIIKSIIFDGDGSKLQPSCQHKCDKNVCNDGRCTNVYLSLLECNCESAVLNGLYCNKSLRKYIAEDFITLKKLLWINRLYLKMSWKQLGDKAYCLMDIVGGNRHDTILIKEGHLRMDSLIISPIKITETNFVSINISDNHLVIKTKASEMKLFYPLSKNTVINVGYSERSDICDTFSGMYDLQFLDNELHYVNKLSRKSLSMNILPTQEAVFSTKHTQLLHFVPLCVVCTVILALIFITVRMSMQMSRIRRQREFDLQLNVLNTTREPSPNINLYDSVSCSRMDRIDDNENGDDYVLPDNVAIDTYMTMNSPTLYETIAHDKQESQYNVSQLTKDIFTRYQ